jgi:hypothetical protein
MMCSKCLLGLGHDIVVSVSSLVGLIRLCFELKEENQFDNNTKED